MANQYFIARGEKQFGPFSGARMKEFATSGRLKSTDTVSKNGLTKGVLAGTIRKLFPIAEAEARPDDTAIPAAKAAAVVPEESVHADSDTSETPAEPALAIKSLEPTLDLVPIPEDPEPPASPSPDARTQTVPVQNPNGTGQGTPPKRRAEVVRGAVIVSQDGAIVHYKKKCSKCGHESLSKNSMPIRIGSTTASFFCPKCKKLRDVVIRGSS